MPTKKNQPQATELIKKQAQITMPFKAMDYILHKGLKNAVEVAMALGQPLLLTGEPGTGKSKLALRVAADLAAYDFNPNPLEFNTKTTSKARDLFYTYDAVAHFQEANIKRKEGDPMPQTVDFIKLQALGKAIAATNREVFSEKALLDQLDLPQANSVVLIDEIDKAPRDFTNDILNEIERYEFRIQELNKTVQKKNEHQILVIMTSNSEKNFPDAFLRRCVFYHIPFPSEALLRKIALKQLGERPITEPTILSQLIKKFEKVREKAPRKKPATAEFIAWLQILELRNYLNPEADKNHILLENLSVLVKTEDDLKAIKALLKEA